MSGKLHGVCAVITNPDGNVVASCADFDKSGYGGLSLAEAQEFRARDAVKSRFAVSHLNGWLSKNMDGYFVDQFWRNAEGSGYRLTTFVVTEAQQ